MVEIAQNLSAQSVKIKFAVLMAFANAKSHLMESKTQHNTCVSATKNSNPSIAVLRKFHAIQTAPHTELASVVNAIARKDGVVFHVRHNSRSQQRRFAAHSTALTMGLVMLLLASVFVSQIGLEKLATHSPLEMMHSDELETQNKQKKIRSKQQ